MYNIVELFSGIGSQAKALKNLGYDINLVGTSEWDIHAIIAYDLIHNDAQMPEDISAMSKDQLLEILKNYTFSNTGKTPLDFKSLRTYSQEVLQHLYLAIRRNNNYVDINAIDGKNLPDTIDILTYSFPCQDLSNVGAFHGYNKGIDKDSGSRSSLLWQVGRILSEMHCSGKKLPRFLLMENVPTLLSERHFKNFTTWMQELRSLGYVSQYYQLNASSFGLPQNRPRLLMISVWVGDDEPENQLVLDYFKSKTSEDIVTDYRQSQYFTQWTVPDLLRINYNNPKIRAEAIEATPNDTVSRKKIWDENPQIILPGGIYNEAIEVVRTITTKQDRNPNSGNLYFESGIPGKGNFRYLTPRECMLFMGFTDADFRQLKDNNMAFHKGDMLFARDKIIRMAGNSIPVKMLEGIFLQITQIDHLLRTHREHLLTDTQRAKFAHQITKALHAKGIRCRAPGGKYPETPDAVFPAYNSVLFVKECFHHSHNCSDSNVPEVNYDFWEDELFRTAGMDEMEYSELKKRGWHVIIVWTCELAKDAINDTIQRIQQQLAEHYVRPYKRIANH